MKVYVLALRSREDPVQFTCKTFITRKELSDAVREIDASSSPLPAESFSNPSKFPRTIRAPEFSLNEHSPPSIAMLNTQAFSFLFCFPDILAFALSSFASIPSRQHVSLRSAAPFYDHIRNNNSASNITEEVDLDAERLLAEIFSEGIKH